MGKFIVKRLAGGALTIFVLITVTFFLTRLMPGNPFQSNDTSRAVLEAMEEEYGLNEPVFTQYMTYLRNLCKGDLGLSFKKPGVTVNEVIARALPATLSVGALAFVVAALVGIICGILKAVTKRKLVSGMIEAGTAVGVGVPGFVAALLLLLVFGVRLKWFPVAGLLTPRHYILPVISLALYPAAVIARCTGTAVSENMKEAYVRMARAKNMPWKTIVRKHILRNAMVPILNAMGPMITFLLTGSFVVESIFTIPGLGREFVGAIGNRDYTMIMGLTIFMGTTVIVVNLVIDILCACIDPRIRQGLAE